MSNKKKCFAIMPFSRTKSCSEGKWTEIFNYIIKPAVEESGLGYECERSVAERQNIIKGILESLNQANVVVADLTDNNPNVFYELGVRHTLANRTILIAQGEEHIPFDLKPYPVAFYSESPAKIAEFKSEIKKKLEDIETNPERADNPVADFLSERNISLLHSEKSANLKKLSALVSEISYDVSQVDRITNQLTEVQERRKKGKKGPFSTPARLANACSQSLVTDQYILLPQKLLENIRQVNTFIGSVNKCLDLWHEFGKNIEKRLLENLPTVKESLIALLKMINKIRLDYANDNYIEPETPAIVLANPEHEEYLKLTEKAT